MKEFYNIIKTEFNLSIKECLRYKISFIGDCIIFTVTYFAIYYIGFTNGFMGNGHTANLIKILV